MRSYPRPLTTGTISGAAISIMDTPSIKQPRKMRIRQQINTSPFAERFDAATASRILCGTLVTVRNWENIEHAVTIQRIIAVDLVASLTASTNFFHVYSRYTNVETVMA